MSSEGCGKPSVSENVNKSRTSLLAHNPKDLAISLSLEATELLEIFQWKDAEEVEAIKSDPESRRRVKEELGDILIYALNLCHAFGFDPSEVILEKLEINEKKYPVEKAKGSAKKYTGSSS